MNRRALTRGISVCLYAGLSLILALMLSGCKPTDFFVEIIVTPEASQVDENNKDRTVINSPDAEKESTALAALDWTDESSQTEDVQNLVTWSDQPNTTLTTHHSIFDLTAHFPGIRASDSVRLLFDENATLQHDLDSDEEVNRDDVTSTGKGKSGQSSSSATNASDADSDMTISGESAVDESADNGTTASDVKGNGGSGADSGDSGNGSAAGGDTAGDDEGGDISDDPSPDPGRTPDYAGYDGSVKRYDRDNMIDPIPTADSVGVIGSQAAVLVQALGGEGSICAMSTYEYESSEGVGTSETFKEVFADEWNASTVYLWDKGGTTADTVDFSNVDVQKFVDAVGYDGVVVYDQNEIVNIDDVLPEDLKKETYGYNIEFLPVDFNTVRGMQESAYMVGQVLSESTSVKQNAVKNAEYYWDFLDDVAGGGNGTGKFSSVSSGEDVLLNIATDAQLNVTPRFGNSTPMQSGIALFGEYSVSYDTTGKDEEKLTLGAWVASSNFSYLGKDETTRGSGYSTYGKENLILLSPCGTGVTLSEDSGNAIGRWIAANRPVDPMNGRSGTGPILNDGGLGSEYIPYLVVCATSDGSMSADEVKKQTVESMLSWKKSGKPTLYSAYGYEYGVPYLEGYGFSQSFIGYILGSSTNPLQDQGKANATVKANPTGALGSWTANSFESVLETVWLAALYTMQPYEGSSYEVDEDVWDGFSLRVGTETVSGDGKTGADVAQEIVSDFYSTFYRYDGFTPDLDL